jgi:hypothetical protein
LWLRKFPRLIWLFDRYSVCRKKKMMKTMTIQLSPYWLRYFELPIVLLGLMVIALNLPYKSFAMITTISLILLAMIRFYVQWRYSITVPLIILLLIFLSVQVDAVGNYLSLYKTLTEPLPYDVFAHFTIPMIIAPVLIWLFATSLEKSHYRLPIGIISFCSVTINFFLSGFYEVIELWDELFFNGKRIWTLHDTSNDLQWGLLGSITGATLTYLWLKIRNQNLRILKGE